MPSVISVDDLLERLADPDLRLIDARFSLSDPSAGRRDYLESHLPGAVYLHLDEDLSSATAEHGGRHPLPAPERAARTFGEAGIGPDTHVVAYDQGDGMTASRVWWLLRWLGHERVQVLDGGLAAWRARGGPESDELPRTTPRSFPAAPDDAMVVDRDWLMAHLQDPDLALIDARAPERFRGETEPIDPVAGHVPGAVNKPYGENLDDGRFKSAEELRERYGDVLGAATIVVYCGSGVSAAHDLIALELAGVRGARLYPGSWSDWVSYPDSPVASGPGGGEADSG